MNNQPLHSKPLLDLNNNTYLLNQAVLWRRQPGPSNIDYPANLPLFSGQTAILDKVQAYNLCNSNSPSKPQRLCCLTVQNPKWEELEVPCSFTISSPTGCTALHGKIYWLAEVTKDKKIIAQMCYYDSERKTWGVVNSQPNQPCRRKYPIFTTIGEFILLYGGIDYAGKKFLSDGFKLEDNVWKSLEVINNPSPRLNAGIAICGSKLYMYGGESVSQTGHIFCNEELYEVQVDKHFSSIQFNLISENMKHGPGPRSGHGMVSLSAYSFALVNGYKYLQVGSKTVKYQFLTDIWVFRTVELDWNEVSLGMGCLSARAHFPLLVHNSMIFLFGGLRNSSKLNHSLQTITLSKFHNSTVQYCSKCLKQDNLKNNKREPAIKADTYSVGFIYQSALTVRHPFEAIKIIFQNFSLLNCTKVSGSITTNNEQLSVIRFYFTCQYLSNQDFIDLCEGSALSPKITTLSKGFLQGSFRLGKTFLLQIKNNGYSQVLLASADHKLGGPVEQSYTNYWYIQEDNSRRYNSWKGENNKTIIMKILECLKEKPMETLGAEESSLTIFHPQFIMTTRKTFYHELTGTQNDIQYCIEEKKLQMFDQLGYNMSQHPEFSLASYLKDLSYSRTMQISLGCNPTLISHHSYLSRLQWHCSKGQLQKIQLNIERIHITRMQIYKCKPEYYLNNNNGILLFSGDKLINRFQACFGELFTTKFFKKKIRPKNNFFQYCGQIHLHPCFKVNSTLTGFINTPRYTFLMACIVNQLQSFEIQASNENTGIETEVVWGNKEKGRKRLKSIYSNC